LADSEPKGGADLQVLGRAVRMTEPVRTDTDNANLTWRLPVLLDVNFRISVRAHERESLNSSRSEEVRAGP
jgi:hypothetical protein